VVVNVVADVVADQVNAEGCALRPVVTSD